MLRISFQVVINLTLDVKNMGAGKTLSRRTKLFIVVTVAVIYIVAVALSLI